MVIIVIVNLYRFITQPIKLSFWVDSSSVIHFKYFPYRNNVLDTYQRYLIFEPPGFHSQESNNRKSEAFFGKYPF